MIGITKPLHNINASVYLSGSKSISNRLLLLNAVLKKNHVLNNLSGSEDTLLLKEVLEKITHSQNATFNVNHAGTDFRFLTAYLATQPGQWILTGSARLKERPIEPLVKALLDLGAEIYYTEKQGFPPLKIIGKELSKNTTEIEAGVSSQFISALLLIAPLLKSGLKLTLKGEPVSEPYLNMTVEWLKTYGVIISQNATGYEVFPGIAATQTTSFYIEPDWSSASYWYSICALSPNSRIFLKGLNKPSLQADSVLPDIYETLGVKTTFKKDGIDLQWQKSQTQYFSYDFTRCPDIAQTVAVTCFSLGINAELCGLQTLQIKETNRILALKAELEKFGATVIAKSNSLLIKTSGAATVVDSIVVNTYHDHRMAMSFAPLALVLNNLIIDDAGVVNKSYPDFWYDLKNAGFSLNLQP